MNNYVQPGKTLTLTAPVGGVVSGGAYLIGGLFVVAVNDADAGDPFEGMCEGVMRLPKKDALALTEGLRLYWDADPGEVTATAGDGVLIGVAASAADAADTECDARLNGAPGLDGSISAGEIETAAVTFVKAKASVSAETTGTGSAQNVAHGLGVIPTCVLVVPTELAADLAAGYDCAEGTHTSTNVVLTVTTGAKFKVFAWV